MLTKIDFIFCSSLIEHIPKHRKLLSEISRILEHAQYVVGTRLLSEFEAGQQCHMILILFDRYLTSHPDIEHGRILRPNSFCYLSFPPFYSPVGGYQFKPYHIFGKNVAVFLHKIIKKRKISGYSMSFGNWRLYPTIIKGIKDLVKDNNFRIINISARFYPISVAKIPFFNEFLTWHIEFLLEKGGNLH